MQISFALNFRRNYSRIYDCDKICGNCYGIIAHRAWTWTTNVCIDSDTCAIRSQRRRRRRRMIMVMASAICRNKISSFSALLFVVAAICSRIHSVIDINILSEIGAERAKPRWWCETISRYAVCEAAADEMKTFYTYSFIFNWISICYLWSTSIVFGILLLCASSSTRSAIRFRKIQFLVTPGASLSSAVAVAIAPHRIQVVYFGIDDRARGASAGATATT